MERDEGGRCTEPSSSGQRAERIGVRPSVSRRTQTRVSEGDAQEHTEVVVHLSDSRRVMP